jgi:uncharacterized membrane protein
LDIGAHRARDLVPRARGCALEIALSGHAGEHEHRDGVPVRRVEAFADGVFAIAATLLILDVAVERSPLSSELLRIWPSYAAYVVTFLTIGVAWVNHGLILSLVDRCDRTFVVMNVLLLTAVAFVPFPTRLLAAHLLDDDARAAALAYGITLVVISLLFNQLWFFGVLRRGLLRSSVDEHVVEGISKSYRPGPFLGTAATLTAFASPQLAAALYAALMVFYLLESTLFARRN